MYQNKFYIAYQNMEAKEQKDFAKYIFANHQKKRIVTRVLRFVVSKKEETLYERSSLETLYKLIFGKEADYNYRKIADAFSDLYLLLEEFFIWKKLVSKELPDREFLLLELFRRRNYDYLFQQKLNQIERDNHSAVVSDQWHFFAQMKLAHYQYFFSDQAKLAKGKSKISEAMEKLDLFYAASKLRYSCELKSRENILQEKHKILFIEQVIQNCLPQKAYQSAYFQVYHQAFSLIESQGLEDYQKLKKMFFKNLESLPPADTKTIFSYLINYTSVAIKDGQTAYIKEAFLLYKKGLQKWIFLENNCLSHTSFNNIINIACRLGKTTWAKKFIEDWEFYLEKGIRKSAVKIGSARIAFEGRQYHQVIELLGDIDFSNAYYGIRAKTLLLRSHYEANTPTNVLLHQCKAFETFLRRNQTINDSTKIGFLNFCKIFKKVLKTNKHKNQLQQIIETTNPLVYKKWLLQKLE